MRLRGRGRGAPSRLALGVVAGLLAAALPAPAPAATTPTPSPAPTPPATPAPPPAGPPPQPGPRLPPDQAKGPSDRTSQPRPPPHVEHPQATAPVDPSLAGAQTGATPPVGARGGDQQLWFGYGSAATYTPGGGWLVAQPAVAVVPSATPGSPGSTLFIATGGDNALYARSDTQGWRRLSTAFTYCIGAPTAAVTGGVSDAVLTVACKGGDSALYYVTSPVTAGQVPAVGGFTRLGGILAGNGAASAVIAGSVVFFVTGIDSRVYAQGVGGAGWGVLPMQCYGHPEAASSGSLAVVSCRGLDNAMWFETTTGSGWSAPQSAAGYLVEDMEMRPLSTDVAVDVGGGDGAIYEIQVGAGGVGSWARLGGLIMPTPESGYVLPVPLYGQDYSLDCETAALQMALAYRGSYWSQWSLFVAESPDTRPAYWDSSGVLHWGDPFTNFVGDVNGSERNYTGYGVYFPPIVGIAQTHGYPAATGAQWLSPSSVYNAVASGHPVQIWIEYRWTRPPMGVWVAWDGRGIGYSTSEHSVLVTGVSDGAIQVNDPLAPAPYWVARPTFETVWADFGYMAVFF